MFEVNKTILASKRAQAGCFKYGREMGSRRFEEMGSGGGVMSSFASQSWEGYLPSPCCSGPPDQAIHWPWACFLTGALPQNCSSCGGSTRGC